MGAFVANFQHQNGVFGHVGGRCAQQSADKVHAIDATGDVAVERQCGFGPEFRRQLGHAVGIDIGRVAQNQVVRATVVGQAVALVQDDALVQTMAFHIDAGHFQRLGTDVRGLHHDIGVNQRGQHGQAAVAGAEVQYPVGGLVEPVIQVAFDQHLGNQRARHNGALIHVKRHALQPGFMGQVGGGFAGLDAGFQKRVDFGLLGGGHQPHNGRTVSICRGLQRRVQRQFELPQHQPGGFVERILGAVTKNDTGLGQLLCRPIDAIEQGDGMAVKRFHLHASNCACRFSSTRR